MLLRWPHDGDWSEAYLKSVNQFLSLGLLHSRHVHLLIRVVSSTAGRTLCIFAVWLLRLQRDSNIMFVYFASHHCGMAVWWVTTGVALTKRGFTVIKTQKAHRWTMHFLTLHYIRTHSKLGILQSLNNRLVKCCWMVWFLFLCHFCDSFCQVWIFTMTNWTTWLGTTPPAIWNIVGSSSLHWLAV